MTGKWSVWKKSDDCKVFDIQKIKHSILKLALRKLYSTTVSDTLQFVYVCNICNMVRLFKAELSSYMSCHDGKQLYADYTQILRQQSAANLWQFCDKICEFAAGLEAIWKFTRLISTLKKNLFLVVSAARLEKVNLARETNHIHAYERSLQVSRDALLLSRNNCYSIL